MDVYSTEHYGILYLKIINEIVQIFHYGLWNESQKDGTASDTIDPYAC